jgi:uncharacterized protein YkwD
VPALSRRVWRDPLPRLGWVLTPLISLLWLLLPPAVAAEPCQPRIQWCDVAIERMLRLVNAERARHGLPDLEYQEWLSAAAAARLTEVERRFSHQRPTGTLPELLDGAGTPWALGGENLGRVLRSGDITAVDFVHQHLMTSANHRNNILSPDYRYVGFSVSYRYGLWYFVQLFSG